MSDPDTLLVDGTDVRSLCSIIGYINMWATLTRRGQDDVIPGQNGVLGDSSLPLDQYSFSFSVKVAGTTRGGRNAAYKALIQAVGGLSDGGLVTLTRRLANADDSGYDEFTAPGRFNGQLAFQAWNPIAGTTELQYTNLLGYWIDDLTNPALP